MNISKFKKVVFTTIQRRALFDISDEIYDSKRKSEWNDLKLSDIKNYLPKLLKILKFKKNKNRPEGNLLLPKPKKTILGFGSAKDRAALSILYQYDVPVYRYKISNKSYHYIHGLVFEALKDTLLLQFNVEFYKILIPTTSIRTVIDYENFTYLKLSLPITLGSRIRIIQEAECKHGQAISIILKNIHNYYKPDNIHFLYEDKYSTDPKLPILCTVYRKPVLKYATPLYSFVKSQYKKIKDEKSAKQVTEFIKNSIAIPLFKIYKDFSALGVLLEFHGQNLLVENMQNNFRFYYRDMEGVRINLNILEKKMGALIAPIKTLKMYDLDGYNLYKSEIQFKFFNAIFAESIQQQKYISVKRFITWLNQYFKDHLS